MNDVFALKDFSFPENFFFGSGYAGHQVEGNNVNSQWWHYEQEGRYQHKSGLACNSYEMYETDVNLAHTLGHEAFRTSVEWSRIEPNEGEFCEEAIEHYVKFFSSLREKGIKVFATMHHGTHPMWFEEKGSFTNLENLKYFERYLEKVVPRIAPYVDYWNVINEFNLCDADYKLGAIRFHARGYHIIKKYSSAPISSSHALVLYQPWRFHDRWDNAINEIRDLQNHEFFFHAIREGELLYPFRDAVYDKELKGAADFWSVNTYVRSLTDARKAVHKRQRYKYSHFKMIESDFYIEEMNPECMIANLTRLKDKPVIITENGLSCNDDRFRIVWIALYLSALHDAMEMGIDVRGYLYWSLLDNFEWGSFDPTFGLCAVNRETFERTIKPSAYFYKEIIENKGFSQEILRKYLNEIPTTK